MYDFLIVGSGLFGSVFAHQMHQAGKRCLIIDKRAHTGGNVACDTIEGINVHKYGPHIFHTNDKSIWQFVNQFAEFNRFTFQPVARYKADLYNLPFNMNTFYQMWDVTTPEQAKRIIESQSVGKESLHTDLESTAISMVGTDIYNKLVKGYTEKQWGRPCSELPAFIIKRLPLRFTYDNNYFDDAYQGIPIGGYNKLISGLQKGIEVRLNSDYFADVDFWKGIAHKIVFSGCIDAYFSFVFGRLEYRSLRFETEVKNTANFQGNAVVNYTDSAVPYTRIIEHKHFEFGRQENTVITREYPSSVGEPYYPINDVKNNLLYKKYATLAEREENVIFGGRLASYRYFNMDQVIGQAIKKASNELKASVSTETSLNR